MSRLIATFFYFGLLPMAPGTVGSFVALPFGMAIAGYGGPFLLMMAVAAVFLLGLWATEKETAGLPDHDPGYIVIDEVAGQWIALAPIAAGIGFFSGDLFTDLFVNLGLAFVLFRVFDITKPFPVSWADRQNTPMGVMLDDVIAGIMAAVVFVILVSVFG